MSNFKKTFQALSEKLSSSFFQKYPQFESKYLESPAYQKAYEKDYEDPLLNEFAESQLRTVDEAAEYVIKEKPRLEQMDTTAEMLVDFANRPYVAFLERKKNE